MTHDALGSFHLTSALLAVITGAFVVRNRKATRQHRLLGYLYVNAMLSANLSALAITRLSGSFNLLHAFALVSLASITVGLIAVVWRRPKTRWFDLHIHSMAWSYIGLLAALVSESATRIGAPWLVQNGYPLRSGFWLLLGLATGAVVMSGALFFYRRLPALERYRPRTAEPLPRTSP
jgi:uncharacterized membrane protein